MATEVRRESDAIDCSAPTGRGGMVNRTVQPTAVNVGPPTDVNAGVMDYDFPGVG